MPLSKARMRERKRLDRVVKPKSNLTVIPTVIARVKPNRLAIARQALNEAVKPIVQPSDSVPWYDKTGASTMDELDASGEVIPDYW